MTKGGNINLTKQAQGLTAVSIGLGWDVSGFGAAVDIDASAVVTGPDGRALSDAHFVFFNNLTSPDGAVNHAGDNATGAGGGDDEQIHVDLVRLAPQADKVSFAVSIHDGQAVQNFGQVRNAYIRVVNQADGREITRYDLSHQSNNETAMIFGELYRHGPDWKFRAVGQGFVDGLEGVIRSFGLSA
nr:TerD family protein [Antrihabitans stalactiti]